MAYRVPGTYARFVPTANTVNNVGETRILALVGTGTNFYNVQDEPVRKSDISLSDKLRNRNVTEVTSVSKYPIYSGKYQNNKIYVKNHDYTLEHGEYICWTPQNNSTPTVNIKLGNGNPNFERCVQALICSEDSQLISDGLYKIEITYLDPTYGTYRITDVNTGDMIGEYGVSDSFMIGIIPGIELQVPTVFIPTIESTPANPISYTQEGDYVLLEVTAPKTQIEPQVSISVPNNTFDTDMTITRGLTYYTIPGSEISTTCTFTTNKPLNGLSYMLKIYDSNGTVFDTATAGAFSYFNVNITGIVNSEYYASNNIAVTSNSFNVADATSKNLTKGDSLEFNIKFLPKSTKGQFFVELSVLNDSNQKLAYSSNTIIVSDDVITHTVQNGSEILEGLIKNLKIITPSKVKSAQYFVCINSLAYNQINVYPPSDLNAVQTFSTNDKYFGDVIPGISFELDAFNTVEGLVDIPGGNNLDLASGVFITTVAGVENDNVPDEGDEYYVSYTYKKAEEDYNPKVFFNYEDVVAAYGRYNVTANGLVINSLSLAAEIAMLNGATPIVCVQAKNNNAYEICNAIDKLEKPVAGLTNINAIVPLSTSKIVGAHLMNHINIMSNSTNNAYRMGYLGAVLDEPMNQEPTITNKVVGSIQSATSYNDERIVYVVPGSCSRDILDPNTNIISTCPLDGSYLAAAVAAIAVKQDPAEPLTNKSITGIDNLLQSYSAGEMNLMAQNGCLILVQEGGNKIKIRHGITTSTLEVNSSEITLIQIKDYVIDACRTTLGALYIGRKLNPSIISDINFTVNNILSQFIAQEIILSKTGVSVKRSPLDPRQIDVTFQIEAVYPLNYIDISFGFSSYNA